MDICLSRMEQKNVHVCYLSRAKAHIKHEGREACPPRPRRTNREKRERGRERERWEAEGAGLEEPAPHPESTLLQT